MKGSYYISLSVIFIDFVLKNYKNYYLLVFLEECKYIVKDKEAKQIYQWLPRTSNKSFRESDQFDEKASDK